MYGRMREHTLRHVNYERNKLSLHCTCGIRPYLHDKVHYRYTLRDLGRLHGKIDENGTWDGAIKRVMDGVSSGVGVTKNPFANFSVSKIFDLAKVPVRISESQSYLTGVTAAELRRHLPNMNAIFNS